MASLSTKRIVVALAVLALGGALFWNLNRQPEPRSTPVPAPRSLPALAPSSPDPALARVEPAPSSPTTTQPSESGPASSSIPAAPSALIPAPAAAMPAQVTAAPVATNLGPEGDITEDLDAVSLTIRDFHTVHGENPVGNNAEITSALLGNNLKQIKLGVPPGSQLSGEGELCDRWGTPYFFHQVSKSTMEVRSAGPDRKMWTSDDSQL